MRLLIIALLVSCAPKPYTSPEWKNVKKIDAVLYAKCLMNSQNEGIPLGRIKKECEEYAELLVSEEKINAILNCYENKKSEQWDKWELEQYCTRLWRGYRL